MATVYNSIFNPVTFDEMLKPHQMYTEAYNQQQGVVNDLDTKASVWEKLAASEKDKDTYDRYKEYENTLRAMAEEMSKYVFHLIIGKPLETYVYNMLKI